MTDSATLEDLEGDLREHKVNKDFKVNLLPTDPVIEDDTQAAIDQLWQDALKQKDRILVDGSVLSVSEISSEEITVQRSSYRNFYAQTSEPSLFETLRVRPLACSSILRCKDGLVLARRSNSVFLEPSLWELAPSGTLDSDAVTESGDVDLYGFLLREMQEELGIVDPRLDKSETVGLFEHLVSHGVDVVTEMQVDHTEGAIKDVFKKNRNREYESLEIVPKNHISAFIAEHRGQLVSLTQRLLERLSAP